MKKKPVIILVSVCVGVWLFSLIGMIAFFGTPKDAGVFGDMFGAVNALFSGLALAFVIYAVFLQLEELEIQREELKNSRKELAAQNEIISAQLKSMRESFEFEKTKEERASEPIFVGIENLTNLNIKKRIVVINKGNTISEVKIICAPELKLKSASEFLIWEHDQKQIISFDGSESYNHDIHLCIQYKDILGNIKSKRFRIPKENANFIEETS